MLRLLAAAVLARAARAQQWVGLVPSSPNAFDVDLIQFNSSGAKTASLATVHFPVASESPHQDALRCGLGFCLFATTDVLASPPVSFIYNVSISTGAVTSRTQLAGTARNLHMDASTGEAWTILFAAGPSAVVTRVLGGAATPWFDMSSVVGNGTVYAGSTTHCSVSDTLFVGIDHPGAALDVVVAVSLANKTVVRTLTLTFPIGNALWAECATGTPGGSVVFDSGVGRRSAVFGSYTPGGAFLPQLWEPIPTERAAAPLQLADILTASEDYLYLAPLYPAGTDPQDPAFAGQLWLARPSGGPHNESFVPVAFYLYAAAVLWT